jgi:hypothetical protein
MAVGFLAEGEIVMDAYAFEAAVEDVTDLSKQLLEIVIADQKAKGYDEMVIASSITLMIADLDKVLPGFRKRMSLMLEQ